MIRYILLSTVLIVFSLEGRSQIGINTLTPDASAALDIQLPAAQAKGILIPRLPQAQRIMIPSPAKGLMVFDTDDNLFYVNLTAGSHNWFAINPWITTATNGTPNTMTTHSTVTNVGIGVPVPGVRLDVNGSIRSNSVVTTNTLSANTVTVAGFPVNPLVPTGAIMMWSGTTAPTGWGLCDGTTYSTPGGSITSPDLRGRFVAGYYPAVADYDQPGNLSQGGVTGGDTGGEEFHTLTKGEIPKHKHVIGTGTDGSSLSNPGDHSHSYQARDGGGHETGNATDNLGYQTYYTGGAGNHTHSGDTGDGTTDGLNGQPHENRPPYYVLAYIIKLP